MKIAFVGGGSVQWTPILVTDMALTETLSHASLVLYDIDAGALDLLARASRRIVAQAGAALHVTTTTDRAEALRDADFVILCVSIGGLAAMRNDLEIPQRYSIYQPVGDTVGPGGLARGLRHIPFAVTVAREMEKLCPRAWLLNLTNPMTTICRATTGATSIRTIGLRHEVTRTRRRLARLFDVPVETTVLETAGINHLPVILSCRISGRDGISTLQEWLVERGPFALMGQRHINWALDLLRSQLAVKLRLRDAVLTLRDWLARQRPSGLVGRLNLGPAFDGFSDRMAVKLTLLGQLGVLFGAADRHVAEFFPGFLTKASRHGRRYGIVLTTVDERQGMARMWRKQVGRIAGGEVGELRHSDEQLAPVMAALAGGPTGQFIVNVPNHGQIDNLPRGAVVECVAEVGPQDIRPLVTGALLQAAYAVIAPHVARQELIAESALTGQREPTLAALATDPLVRDPATVEPMLDELMAANGAFTAA
jgi:alpha-galactosidase